MKIKQGSIFNLSIFNEESLLTAPAKYSCYEHERGLFTFSDLISNFDFDLKSVYEEFCATLENAEQQFFKYNRPKTEYFGEYLLKKGICIKLNIATINFKVTPKKKLLSHKLKPSYSTEVVGEIYVIGHNDV